MKKGWGVFLLVGALFGSLEARAQNAYPPSGFIKVGSQVSLELRQTWNSTISGKDSDGDWTGDVRGTNGTVGKLFAFSQDNNAFAFQVVYTGASEYCFLAGANTVSSSSASSTTYVGTRFYKQGTANAAADNAPCRVTVSNGSSTVTQPVQPVQPPSLPGTQAQIPTLTFPPRLEVGQRWEFRLGNRPVIYRGALTGLDSARNVYTGSLITENATNSGIAGDSVRERKLEMFFAQDTLATYATDPQGGVTVCSFKGAGTLQNNVLTGDVFFKGATESQFRVLTGALEAPCKLNLEPVAQTNQPVQPVQPVQPSQNLTATVPAQVGDTWRITANGFQPWILSFTSLDKSDAAGTATQGTAQGDTLGIKLSNGGYSFLIGIVNRIFACTLAPNATAQGATLTGSLFEIVTVGNQNQTKDLQTACSAILTARGTAAAVVTQPVQTLSANFPPRIGQTWAITIDGFAPWVVLFQDLNKVNEPSGTGLQNGRARLVLAYVNNGLKIFAMAGENEVIYYCAFAANTQAVGATFSGGTAFQEPKGAQQPTSMNRSCTATLTAQQILKAASTSIETRVSGQFLNILRLSPLF